MIKLMTVLEQRYMNVMCSYIPRLEKSIERLNDNVEKLAELLLNRDLNK